jgi:hypothetical protein
VRAAGGFGRLNAVAIGCMRRWAVDFSRDIVGARADASGPLLETSLKPANELAQLLLANGDVQEAADLLERLVESAETLMGPNHELTLAAELSKVRLLTDRGQYSEGCVAAAALVVRAKQHLEDGHTLAIQAQLLHAGCVARPIGLANWSAYMNARQFPWEMQGDTLARISSADLSIGRWPPEPSQFAEALELVRRAVQVWNALTRDRARISCRAAHYVANASRNTPPHNLLILILDE